MEQFVSVPVPTQFVPAVTTFLAGLYAGTSATNGPATLTRAGAPGEDDLGTIWTEEQYEALLAKDVISSGRVVAFLNHLPTGEENQKTLPEIAQKTGEYTEGELAAALRWLGKFTANTDLFEASVWCFEYTTPDYGPRYTGPRYSTYWFEPHQREAWERAAAAYNAS